MVPGEFFLKKKSDSGNLTLPLNRVHVEFDAIAKRCDVVEDVFVEGHVES